jgi:hypothetical protein
MFLISTLALAGIGVSYAGFTDEIYVYGTVDCGTVEFEIVDGWYSGTWVYKIWGFEEPEDPPGDPDYVDPVVYDLDDEILIYRGFTQLVPPEGVVLAWASNNGGFAELIAYSEAMPGTTSFPDPAIQDYYDVDIVYDEILPCIDFTSDFIIHYTGSLPCKTGEAQIMPITQDEYDATGTGFLTYLWEMYQSNPTDGFGAWVEAYRCYPIHEDPTDPTTPIIGWTIDYSDPIDETYQLHYCYYVYLQLTIHLPQDNFFQGLSGTFGGMISVIQWYDPPCGDD